tara:strand:- start:254 stop:478 length:225 start_codon:yes stop_codon:yes gene_type:complete
MALKDVFLKSAGKKLVKSLQDAEKESLLEGEYGIGILVHTHDDQLLLDFIALKEDGGKMYLARNIRGANLTDIL